MLKLGRKPVFKDTQAQIISLTGNPIHFVGEVEFILDSIGVVKFLVVKDMRHDIILGIDELRKHGYFLNDKFFLWGSDAFELSVDNTMEICEMVQCDNSDDNLKPVLSKYKEIFQEKDLPTANLPAIEITRNQVR